MRIGSLALTDTAAVLRRLDAAFPGRRTHDQMEAMIEEWHEQLKGYTLDDVQGATASWIGKEDRWPSVAQFKRLAREHQAKHEPKRLTPYADAEPICPGCGTSYQLRHWPVRSQRKQDSADLDANGWFWTQRAKCDCEWAATVRAYVNDEQLALLPTEDPAVANELLRRAEIKTQRRHAA